MNTKTNQNKLSDHDKATFKKIRELIPEEEIAEAGRFAFVEGAFPRQMLDWIYEFENWYSRHPSFIFADKELELYRQELHAAAEALFDTVTSGTEAHPYKKDWWCVHAYLKKSDPAKYEAIVQALQAHSQRCYEPYAKLVRSGCVRPD